jgi:hypothetical protein
MSQLLWLQDTEAIVPLRSHSNDIANSITLRVDPVLAFVVMQWI